MVAVTMDDFRRSGWWERGAEDTAELRNMVVFLTTVIHLFSEMLGWSTKRMGRMACLARRVVGQCRGTASQRWLADVSFCVVSDQVVT